MSERIKDAFERILDLSPPRGGKGSNSILGENATADRIPRRVLSLDKPVNFKHHSATL